MNNISKKKTFYNVFEILAENWGLVRAVKLVRKENGKKTPMTL
jgi:hypothetical protein